MSQRRILTLNEKHEAIKKMESGKSARAVAKEMGVGKTQITQISKRKAEILCDIENNVPGKRKRKRHKTGNEEINDLCWSWFQEAMTHKINVIGPLLKEQALKFASDLKIKTFKASKLKMRPTKTLKTLWQTLTDFLYKATQFAKTSPFGTVIDLDDKFTKDFLLTKQCKISDFFSV